MHRNNEKKKNRNVSSIECVFYTSAQTNKMDFWINANGINRVWPFFLPFDINNSNGFNLSPLLPFHYTIRTKHSLRERERRVREME